MDDFNQTLAEAKHDRIERKALSAKKPKFKKPLRRRSPAEQIETTQIIPTAHLCVNPKKVNELQAGVTSKFSSFFNLLVYQFRVVI